MMEAMMDVLTPVSSAELSVQDREPSLNWLSWFTLVLTVGGWIAVHWFALRAQRASLRLDLLNAARVAVYSNIASYKRWCLDVNTACYSMRTGLDLALGPLQITDIWRERLERLNDLLFRDPRALEWLESLEAQEPLLPWSRDIRVALGWRQIHVIREIESSVFDLSLNDPDKSRIAIDHLTGRTFRFIEMMGLAHDLSIQVQRRCLASVVDVQLAPRMVLGMLGPRIVEDENGLLVIREGLPEAIPAGPPD